MLSITDMLPLTCCLNSELGVVDNTRVKAQLTRSHPTGNYMFKVNNRNTRKMCEIDSKLTNNKDTRTTTKN